MLKIIQINAQDIKGKVLEIGNQNNTKPLIGASVFWENTNIGTLTDSQGRYTIPKATKLPATLNVSYIGYSIKEKEIVNNEYIFYMQSSIDLEEVDVQGKKQTTIFSTVKPLNVQTITTDEILKAACCNLSECFETNAAVDVTYSDAISGIKTINMIVTDIYDCSDTISKNIIVIDTPYVSFSFIDDTICCIDTPMVFIDSIINAIFLVNFIHASSTFNKHSNLFTFFMIISHHYITYFYILNHFYVAIFH